MKTKILTTTSAAMWLTSAGYGLDYGLSVQGGPLWKAEVDYMRMVLQEFKEVDMFIEQAVADWESGKACANTGFVQTPIQQQGNLDAVAAPLEYILVVKDSDAAITFDNLEFVESSADIIGTKAKVYVKNDSGSSVAFTTIDATASNLADVFTLNAAESVAQGADSDLVSITMGSIASDEYSINADLAALLTDETPLNLAATLNTYVGASNANIGNLKALLNKEVLADISGDSATELLTYTDGAESETLRYFSVAATGDAVSGISRKQGGLYTTAAGGTSTNATEDDGTTARTVVNTALSSNNVFTAVKSTNAIANGIGTLSKPEDFGVTGNVIENIVMQADCAIVVKFYDYEDLINESSAAGVTHERNAYIIPELEGMVIVFRPMERDANMTMKVVDETTDYTLAEISEFDCFAVHIDNFEDGLISQADHEYMLFRGEGKIDTGDGTYDERIMNFNMLLGSEILSECAFRELIASDGTADSPYDGTTSLQAY